MTIKANDVLRQALELADADRAEIAGKLIMSLDSGADEEIEAAWSAEIARRIASIDAGEARFVTWDELRSRLSHRPDEPNRP